ISPATAWRASTISGMAARDRIISIHSRMAILAPFAGAIISGSIPEGIHLGYVTWAGVPNCSHIFRPYPNRVSKADGNPAAGTGNNVGFRPRIRRLSKAPVQVPCRSNARARFKLNHNRALDLWWSMIFSENPASTFPDHAL